MVNEFNPDWRSPPGDTIRDILSLKGMTIEEFSALTALPLTDAKDLLNGHLSISETLAKTLARVLGGSAQFWIKRNEDFYIPLPEEKI